jgi:hypothetical protein
VRVGVRAVGTDRLEGQASKALSNWTPAKSRLEVGFLRSAKTTTGIRLAPRRSHPARPSHRQQRAVATKMAGARSRLDRADRLIRNLSPSSSSRGMRSAASSIGTTTGSGQHVTFARAKCEQVEIYLSELTCNG